uniref:EB domain-containing protein n=1 Tax=Angiostrongylus cantonensis TaxID=6313 RepID=A0A0K0DFG3_ANGCA
LYYFNLGKSAIGGICDVNADCERKGSICLRNRCRCHPHYIEVKDEKGRNVRCVPLYHPNHRRISHFTFVFGSRVGDRCTRHYDCTSPFSACLNSQCVCISGTIQQGSRCVAAANCPLGGLPGQTCVIKTEASLAFNLPSNQDDCPPGQSCVTAPDSPVGHCCPVVCPLASHVDTKYSCEPNATRPQRCPSDTHFCHLLSDGLVSQAVCCRRPCNALAPNALYANNECIPRGQLNSACTTNAQCGGGEGMECVKVGFMLTVTFRLDKLYVVLVSELSSKMLDLFLFQGQCQCLSGFHPTVDSLTHPAKNPSQTCSRDCESEALSKDTSCMKPGSLGSLCFVQRQCPQNSGCYRGRCMCRCGFEQKSGKCVALPPPPTTTSQSNSESA